MFIVQVRVHVRRECVDDFIDATRDNAENSLEEPGIARFDVLRQKDDDTAFLLVEVYRTPEDATVHKGTPHYQRWRDAVEPMMAEPRVSVRYSSVFPRDDGWD